MIIIKTELKSADIKRIRGAAKHCAFYEKECYDYDFKAMRKDYCILLETTCDICNRCFARNTKEARNGCGYFEKSVLPAFPELEAIWFGTPIPTGIVRKLCPYCGKVLYAGGNARYCSDACRAKNQRLLTAKRKRKSRANKDGCHEFNP